MDANQLFGLPFGIVGDVHKHQGLCQNVGSLPGWRPGTYGYGSFVIDVRSL